MRLIKNNALDPYFNLACEEYLMQNEARDVFMLWQNPPSVIIGSSQNAYAEVNISYANERGIRIARRLTGGGAVYHDLGNINFSVIVKEDGQGIDFSRFLAPVAATLNSLGASVVINGRNDLELHGLKVSGNAQCHRYGRILHHGTLLYRTDTETLSRVLTVDPEKLKSKGVTSVRSRVGQLADHIDIELHELIDKLSMSFECEDEPLSREEINGIKTLADEKYSRWEYIFGKSRSFERSVKKRFEGGSVEISYNSDNGIILDAVITGDFFTDRDPSLISEAIIGSRAEPDEIEKRISSSGCRIYGISYKELADMMFE